MKTVIYGIRNCDTMRKARQWLESRHVEYAFHDYKVSGVDRGRLEKWVGLVGWEILLNRAGTTFRKLPEGRRQGLDAQAAMALMLEYPAMIKRPVLEQGARLLVGFRPDQYASLE